VRAWAAPTVNRLGTQDTRGSGTTHSLASGYLPGGRAAADLTRDQVMVPHSPRLVYFGLAEIQARCGGLIPTCRRSVVSTGSVRLAAAVTRSLQPFRRRRCRVAVAGGACA
jgi:hypothetical protein